MWLGQELVMVRVRVLPEVTAHQSSPKMHMTSYTKCTCARSSWLKTFDVVLTSAFWVIMFTGQYISNQCKSLLFPCSEDVYWFVCTSLCQQVMCVYLFMCACVHVCICLCVHVQMV